MANSITYLVKESINHSPFISEMLMEDIISFSNLAKYLQPKIEKQLGMEVSLSSIVMAIRRYSVELKEKRSIRPQEKLDYSIYMQTNIYDVNYAYDDSFTANLHKLYEKVGKGDYVNLSIGNEEISLMVSNQHKALVREIFPNLVVTHEMDDLVAINISFKGNYIMTPGLIYVAVRKLAWEQINIIEVISTLNNLSFVVEKENAASAYASLQSLFDDEMKN